VARILTPVKALSHREGRGQKDILTDASICFEPAFFYENPFEKPFVHLELCD
jgi:hypothetical protein